MSETKNNEGNALRRVVKLPLVNSALQLVTGVYVEAKGRYPLLSIMGGVAELSLSSISTVASRRAAPLIQSLESEIETVNGYALVGLDQLEKSFPVFQQSADEVIEGLKQKFFLRLGDVQSRVNEELDSMTERWERLLRLTWHLLEEAQASGPGQALTSAVDDVLCRSEEAAAYYLPLPPTLRREWELRVQNFEDEDENEEEDDNDEPRMWTRVRSLLLFLYLQLYHRFQQMKERAESLIEFLGEAADVAGFVLHGQVGLTRLMEAVSSLLQLLFSLYTSQMQRVATLRSVIMAHFTAGVQVLMELSPVQQLLALPAQVRTVMGDLLELGQILIQLLINTTPLYDLLQQFSDQNASDFEAPDVTTSRSSANSLFLKAMDGRSRRRRSLYARYRRSSLSGNASNLSLSLSPAPSSPPAQAPAPAPVQPPSPDPSPTPNPAKYLASFLARATSPVPTPAEEPIPDPAKALDVLQKPNPDEAQDSIHDPDVTEAVDGLLQPNPFEANEPLPDSNLVETLPKAPNSRKGSLMKDGQLAGLLEPGSPTSPSSSVFRRRSSTKEVLLAPIMQFVSQSQRAFEYLSSSSYSEDQVTPEVETSEQ